MRTALVLLTLCYIATTGRADDLAARARKLVHEAIVVDGHLDAPDQLSEKWADVAKRGATDHFDLPRAKEGGLTAPFFSIFVSPAFEHGGAARHALELIDLTRRVVADHPAELVMASSVADIRAAKQAGKLAVLMGLEGGHALEDSLGVLRELYQAGVRYVTLTHMNTNHWADSSGAFLLPDFDPKTYDVHHGLTGFGREMVKEMNRIGMIVDISHTSDATVDAVLAVSRAPVLASHSSCRALTDMPRDLTDDQLKRIAAKHGVVMINIGSQFISTKTWTAFVAMRTKLAPAFAKLQHDHPGDLKAQVEGLFGLYAKQPPLPRATLADVADHIEHVIKVAGIEAVGLGTDFDGIKDPPVGLEDYSKLPSLVEELLRRGHSDDDIKKILGENFLAFLARVEATRAALVKEPPGTAVYKPDAK
jgi:membrane dipeptidase